MTSLNDLTDRRFSCTDYAVNEAGENNERPNANLYSDLASQYGSVAIGGTRISRGVARCVAMLTVVVMAMIGVKTYGVTVEAGAEELYAEFLSEETAGARWCRWTLNVPGTALGQPGGTTLSGISKVELREEWDGTTTPRFLRQYIVIHDFRGIGDLWLRTAKYTRFDGEDKTGEGTASLEKTKVVKFISADGATIGKLRYSDNIRTASEGQYIRFDDFNKSQELPLIEAKKNESGNLVVNLNNNTGYILYFGSQDGMLPKTGDRLPNGTILDYYTDITLEFFAGGPNTKIVSGTTGAMTTKEYPATIRTVDFNGTTGSITVNGLYGHAKEMRANCFDAVAANGVPGFEEAPISITLNADGTAKIDRRWSAAGPILNTSWQSMALKAAGSEPSINMDTKNRNIWFVREQKRLKYYTDLLIAENDLGEIKNTTEEVIALHKRIVTNDLKPVTGTWTTSANGNADLPNSHWHRGDNTEPTTGTLTISLAPHHILPLTYNYNEYYGKPGRPYNESYLIDVAEPKNVETLTLNVPVDGVTDTKPTYTGENYGNEDLGNGRGRQLYISGTVTGADDIFIVRGALPDYAAAEMSNTEKGHSEGLLISDGNYDTAYIPATAPVTAPATVTATEAQTSGSAYATAARAKTKHINVLVPDADIPGNTALTNVYTLYGRTRTANGYRFDMLTELNRIVTGVSEVTTDHAASTSYRLDGRTITATATVIVTDITGRVIATLTPGQSATIAPGHYLVTASAYRTTTHLLIK